MVRDNGIKTYFASDIAYVLNKLERGFDHLLYIWVPTTTATSPPARGPDRVGRSRGVIRGAPGPVRIAVPRRRKGPDVDALRRVRHAARPAQGSGNDAARLFYVMRSNDQHLDFDLELATARSNDNPV